MDFRQIIESAGQYLDFAGVAVMVIGGATSGAHGCAGADFPGGRDGQEGISVYRQYRQLLAGPYSLALSSSSSGHHPHGGGDSAFTSVGVLAVIVLIRTFLSFSLELEMTGR